MAILENIFLFKFYLLSLFGILIFFVLIIIYYLHAATACSALAQLAPPSPPAQLPAVLLLLLPTAAPLWAPPHPTRTGKHPLFTYALFSAEAGGPCACFGGEDMVFFSHTVGVR